MHFELRIEFVDRFGECITFDVGREGGRELRIKAGRSRSSLYRDDLPTINYNIDQNTSNVTQKLIGTYLKNDYIIDQKLKITSKVH